MSTLEQDKVIIMLILSPPRPSQIVVSLIDNFAALNVYWWTDEDEVNDENRNWRFEASD